MTDIAKSYARALHNCFFGKAWHGPALMEVLDGIDAAAANARPLPGAHSIWELVHHIHVWNRIMLAWLHHHSADVALGSEQDFPPVRDASDAAWRRTLEELVSTFNDVEKKVSSLGEDDLTKIVPGRKYDFHTLCAGLPHHFTYHGGQIALLKKSALASRAAKISD